MSSKSPRRPSRPTGEEYREVLSGLVAEERARSGRARDGSGRGGRERLRVKKGRGPVTFLLSAALVGLIAWNIYAWTRPLEASPESQRRMASVKLYHTAQGIERYRAAQARLPDSLAGLNVPAGDVEYLRGDTGYILVLRTPDTENRYMSGDGLLELLARAGVAGGEGAPEAAFPRAPGN